MRIPLVVALLALVALAAWAWQRHGGDLQRALRSGPAAQQATKCLRGGQVLYTDGPCPAGSRPAALEGGAVTVLPAAPAARPTLPAASLPNARQVLAPEGTATLRDQRMEQIIGK